VMGFFGIGCGRIILPGVALNLNPLDL
jgi:hypothetical protein